MPVGRWAFGLATGRSAGHCESPGWAVERSPIFWLRPLGCKIKRSNLVLLPTTQAPELRRWLYENGVCVTARSAGVGRWVLLYGVASCFLRAAHGPPHRYFASWGYCRASGVRQHWPACQKAERPLEQELQGRRLGGRNRAGVIAGTGRCGKKGAGRMPRVEEVRAFLDELAPQALAEEWDNVGTLVDCGTEITSVMMALDITEEVVIEAEMAGCQLIVSHHPVIFHPMRTLRRADVPFRMVKKNISAICMHTNMDAADGGVNDILAAVFGLTEVVKFGRHGAGRPPARAACRAKACRTVRRKVCRAGAVCRYGPPGRAACGAGWCRWRLFCAGAGGRSRLPVDRAKRATTRPLMPKRRALA